MTSAYIDISTSASRISNQARSAIDTLRRVKDDWSNLKLIFDQVALGDDFTVLSGYLGVNAEQAEAIYNLWGSANAELQDATFIAQLLSRCG
jgi:hypothetical protein